MCAGNELFFVLLYILSVANIAQPLNSKDFLK